MSVNEIAALLLQHRGKQAMVNQKESQFYGWIVIDVEPLKPPEKSISIIEAVTSNMLVLNYFDAKEMHHIPLDKIIKVNVISRER